MEKQTTPLLVSSAFTKESEKVHLLMRHPLGRESEYNERWIQNLVDKHPSVLPISSIEPAFQSAVSCCMEMPLRSGFLDNLLVTPFGDLILVECKLWLNPESRRKVIAQVIDYAKDLQNLDFEDLESSIATARGSAKFNLFKHVCECDELNHAELDEAEFIDRVSRNLRRGRFLLLIVGDGITENLVSMTEFLQQHTGLHFALALVQLAVYEVPDSKGELLVIPSVPMRTENIVRGIVQIVDGQISVSKPEREGKSQILSEEGFFAGLDHIEPGTSERLKQFLADCASFHVVWTVKKTLIIKMVIGNLDIRPWVISPEGLVDTGYLSWFSDRNVYRNFVERLQHAIPGTFIKETDKSLLVKKRDRSFNVWELLDNAAGCLAALQVLQADMEAFIQANPKDGDSFE